MKNYLAGSVLSITLGLLACNDTDARHPFDGSVDDDVSGPSGTGRDTYGNGGEDFDTNETGDTEASTDDPYDGQCALLMDGATGNEPEGQIPVCCAPTEDQKPVIMEVFRLLNEHRATNGVDPLTYDNQLEAAIQGHCRHMAEHSFFEHNAPEASVSSPWDRAALCGTNASGENIANGYNSPDDVMAGWISSSGHNRNMLDSGFSRVGIGYVSLGQWDSYWGQIFGN